MDLTPIFRIEYFLDAIVNSTTPELEPLFRIEKFLARIAGVDVETPEPLYRVEKYLAKIAGDNVEIPDPIFRIEYYLASLCGMDVITPEPIFRIEYWLSEWASGPTPILKTAVGNPIHITDALARTIDSLKVEFVPIQSGSGDPSPDNVRPITGWTSANVWRTGKNLYPYESIAAYTYGWYISSTAFSSAEYPVFLKGGTHYVLSYANENSDAKPLIRAWDGTKTFLDNKANVLNARMYGAVYPFAYNSSGHFYNGPSEDSSNTVEIEPTEDIWIDMRIQSGKGTGTSVMLAISATAQTYSPYSGTTIPLTWTAQGTQYGGYVELTTGELWATGELEVFDDVQQVQNYSVILSQLDSWSTNSAGIATVGDVTRISFAVRTDVDQSKHGRASNVYAYKMCNLAKHYFAYNDTSVHWYKNTILYVFLPTALVGSTAQSVYDYLVSIKDTTPLSFWIPYNEPQLVTTLTPQELVLLANENNIWSDTNGNLTLSYYADGNASTLEALNTLLGGRYVNNHGDDEPSDEEALRIIMGETR